MKAAIFVATFVLLACTAADEDHGIDVDLGLPQHFPEPIAPLDNRLTTEAIELGRHLFYDTRLSGNETLACATCHKQELAFADSLALSTGATGDEGVLNAPSLANAIYAFPLTWAQGAVHSIEEQLMGPMFGDAPLEMGMAGLEDEIVERLVRDARYRELFADAYPGEDISVDSVRLALASFVRSLVSYRSPFDLFLAGDIGAISGSASRGSELFYSERLGCSNCHAGFAFTTAVQSSATNRSQTSPFHNIGLYNIDGEGSYPANAQGRIAESGFAKDMGRFRVPSLRNVALTAPYGHDGSVATLEEFIRIYEDGGRRIESGPHAGDGRENPWRSSDLNNFELSDDERSDLIAFLTSLSDASFVADSKFSNPW
tara:strand:- start:16354 stop:17472 length:1119 start_codon:yes stop_codon:yes gene_type:complete